MQKAKRLTTFSAAPFPDTTYKGHMGHTLGACGALEAIFAVHAMMEGFVSPILNLEEPDPECAPLDFVMGGVRELEQKIIMSNNFRLRRDQYQSDLPQVADRRLSRIALNAFF